MLVDRFANGTNHTIVNLIIERSNTMAAFVSASSVPVSSVGLAGVGLILKHFKVIDLGYETASNKTQ